MNGVLGAITGFINQIGAWSYQNNAEWTAIKVGSGTKINYYLLDDTFGQILAQIMPVIDMVSLILLIAVGAAGTAYAIILGVNLARAEDAEKREAAKKRLIWAVVGVVAIILICLILQMGMGPMIELILTPATPTQMEIANVQPW